MLPAWQGECAPNRARTAGHNLTDLRFSTEEGRISHINNFQFFLAPGDQSQLSGDAVAVRASFPAQTKTIDTRHRV